MCLTQLSDGISIPFLFVMNVCDHLNEEMCLLGPLSSLRMVWDTELWIYATLNIEREQAAHLLSCSAWKTFSQGIFGKHQSLASLEYALKGRTDLRHFSRRHWQGVWLNIRCLMQVIWNTTPLGMQHTSGLRGKTIYVLICCLICSGVCSCILKSKNLETSGLRQTRNSCSAGL